MEICLVVIQYLLVNQNLSKRFLKQLTVSAETTWFVRLFGRRSKVCKVQLDLVLGISQFHAGVLSRGR